MERAEVISILETLATSAEKPDVGRALTFAADELKRRPVSAGKPWTADEDQVLCREFDEGRPIGELASTHGRTSGAIKSRLVKLGRLDPSTVSPRFRQ